MGIPGPVRTVVRAHYIRNGRVATELIMTAWKLAWMGMLAIAASGVVALGMNVLLGRGFVGAAPPRPGRGSPPRNASTGC